MGVHKNWCYAEVFTDWSWDKPLGPFVFGLLEQDAKEYKQCNEN